MKGKTKMIREIKGKVTGTVTSSPPEECAHSVEHVLFVRRYFADILLIFCSND
jgi:hypothetical protein